MPDRPPRLLQFTRLHLAGEKGVAVLRLHQSRSRRPAVGQLFQQEVPKRLKKPGKTFLGLEIDQDERPGEVPGHVVGEGRSEAARTLRVVVVRPRVDVLQDLGPECQVRVASASVSGESLSLSPR